MLEYALYKIPKKMGWFKVKSVEEADDDFKEPNNDILELERPNESDPVLSGPLNDSGLVLSGPLNQSR